MLTWIHMTQAPFPLVEIRKAPKRENPYGAFIFDPPGKPIS